MPHPSHASLEAPSGPHKNVTASGLFLVEPRVFRCQGTLCLVLNKTDKLICLLFVCYIFETKSDLERIPRWDQTNSRNVRRVTGPFILGWLGRNKCTEFTQISHVSVRASRCAAPLGEGLGSAIVSMCVLGPGNRPGPSVECLKYGSEGRITETAIYPLVITGGGGALPLP
jgi:hypothetical protein